MTTRYRLVHEDGLNYFVTEQDCTAILDRNKQLQTERQSREASFRHIACIPNQILVSWLQREWARGNVDMKYLDQEHMRICMRYLQDPNWKWLRTV